MVSLLNDGATCCNVVTLNKSVTSCVVVSLLNDGVTCCDVVTLNEGVTSCDAV